MVSLSNHARRSCGGRNLAAPTPVIPAPAESRVRGQRTRWGLGGVGRCHAERSPRFSAQHPLSDSPLMVSLSNHARRSCGGRNLAAHAPVIPAKAGIQTRVCAARMRSRRTRWGVGEGLSCRAKPRHLSGVLVPARGEPVEPPRRSRALARRRQEPRSPCPRHASQGWYPDARLRRAHAQSAHTVGRGRGPVMPTETEASLGDSPLMVSLSNHPAEAGTSQPMPRHASEGWYPDVRLRRAHAQSAHTVGRGREPVMLSGAEASLGDGPLMVSLSNHPAEAGTSHPRCMM